MTDVQFIITPAGRMAVIPEDEYRQLVEAAQDRADLATIDAHKKRVAEGEDVIPSSVADRLFAGENPVRVWREHRGLTMQELGEKAEVSQGYISQIENGQRGGGRLSMGRLARVLGVTVDDLWN